MGDDQHWHWGHRRELAGNRLAEHLATAHADHDQGRREARSDFGEGSGRIATEDADDVLAQAGPLPWPGSSTPTMIERRILPSFVAGT